MGYLEIIDGHAEWFDGIVDQPVNGSIIVFTEEDGSLSAAECWKYSLSFEDSIWNVIGIEMDYSWSELLEMMDKVVAVFPPIRKKTEVELLREELERVKKERDDAFATLAGKYDSMKVGIPWLSQSGIHFTVTTEEA